MEKLKKSEKNCMQRILTENDTNILCELDELSLLIYDKDFSKEKISIVANFFDEEELEKLSSEKELLRGEILHFIINILENVKEEINHPENKSYLQIYKLYKIYNMFMQGSDDKLKKSDKLCFSMELEKFIKSSPYNIEKLIKLVSLIK